MTTEEICALPVKKKYVGGVCCLPSLGDLPNIREALRVMEAWGFEYRTPPLCGIKKNRKNGGNFWGMGAYTRSECGGVPPGDYAGDQGPAG